VSPRNEIAQPNDKSADTTVFGFESVMKNPLKALFELCISEVSTVAFLSLLIFTTKFVYPNNTKNFLI
jgi:hypothetical protein